MQPKRKQQFRTIKFNNEVQHLSAKRMIHLRETLSAPYYLFKWRHKSSRHVSQLINDHSLTFLHAVHMVHTIKIESYKSKQSVFMRLRLTQ